MLLLSLVSPSIKTRGAAYADGGLTAARATRAEQFLSEVPEKNRYSVPAGWGLGVGLTFPSLKKLIVLKFRQ
jgi:hypothetical protein